MDLDGIALGAPRDNAVNACCGSDLDLNPEAILTADDGICPEGCGKFDLLFLRMQALSRRSGTQLSNAPGADPVLCHRPAALLVLYFVQQHRRMIPPCEGGCR